MLICTKVRYKIKAFFYLFQSSKECNHVYANVRETGTEISWYGCDFREPTSEGRCSNK